MDPLAWLAANWTLVAAVVLVVAGVVGSLVPSVPGPALPLAGDYLHWWATGYAEPGLAALAGFTVAGLAAVVVP